MTSTAINHSRRRRIAPEQFRKREFSFARHDIFGARSKIFFRVISRLWPSQHDAPARGAAAFRDFKHVFPRQQISVDTEPTTVVSIQNREQLLLRTEGRIVNL